MVRGGLADLAVEIQPSLVRTWQDGFWPGNGILNIQFVLSKLICKYCTLNHSISLPLQRHSLVPKGVKHVDSSIYLRDNSRAWIQHSRVSLVRWNRFRVVERAKNMVLQKIKFLFICRNRHFLAFFRLFLFSIHNLC